MYLTSKLVNIVKQVKRGYKLTLSDAIDFKKSTRNVVAKDRKISQAVENTLAKVGSLQSDKLHPRVPAAPASLSALITSLRKTLCYISIPSVSKSKKATDARTPLGA
nr:hypothetical protein [Tanacetum cinerariifolium]